MSEMIEDRTLFLAALQRAGIASAPEEISAMVAAYSTAREGVGE